MAFTAGIKNRIFIQPLMNRTGPGIHNKNARSAFSPEYPKQFIPGGAHHYPWMIWYL
jgi:hypothetical protein